MVEITALELEGMVGLELGTSEWLVVEQPRIDTFAMATEDHQWVHVNPGRAAAGPFRSTIAHGYLTLSLVPRLLTSILVISDEAQNVNYGLDHVRFTSPVVVGSHIRLATSCVDVQRRPDAAVMYRLKHRIDIKNHDRPAMVGESIYLSYAK